MFFLMNNIEPTSSYRLLAQPWPSMFMGLGGRCTICAGPCTVLAYTWGSIAALFKSWFCVVQSHCFKKKQVFLLCIFFFSIAKGKADVRELDGTCVSYLKNFLVLP